MVQNNVQILSARPTVSDQIVLLLADGHARRVVDIQAELGQAGTAVSLKGIYKAIDFLEGHQWLSKYKLSYSLNITKILEVQDFWADVYDQSLVLLKRNLLDDKAIKKWRFQSLRQFMPFNNQLFILLMAQARDPYLCEWTPYPWYHLCGTAQEERFLQTVMDQNIRIDRLIGTSGYLADIMHPAWGAGHNRYSYARSSFHSNKMEFISVIDDWIVKVKIQKPLRQELDTLFRAGKEMAGLLSMVDRVVTRHHPIALTLEKNAAQASAIRKKFIDFFDI